MDSDNPLQMADQGPPPDNPEPSMVDWVQPYSSKGEAPTSSPANPPQPRGAARTDPNLPPEQQPDRADEEDDEEPES